MASSKLLGSFLRNLSDSNNQVELLIVEDNAKISSAPKKRLSIRRFHSQPICLRSKLLAAKELSRWEPCPFLSPGSTDGPLSFPERSKEEELDRSCVGRNRSDSILLRAPKHSYEMESLPLLSVIHQNTSSSNSICLEAEQIILENPKSGNESINNENVEKKEFSSTLSMVVAFYNLVKLFEVIITLILSSISSTGRWLFLKLENFVKVATTQNEDREEKIIESLLEQGSWEPCIIL